MIPGAAVEALAQKRAEHDAYNAAAARADKEQARLASRVNPRRK